MTVVVPAATFTINVSPAAEFVGSPPCTVIAGPPVVMLDAVECDVELEVDGIGALACPLA